MRHVARRLSLSAMAGGLIGAVYLLWPPEITPAEPAPRPAPSAVQPNAGLGQPGAGPAPAPAQSVLPFDLTPAAQAFKLKAGEDRSRAITCVALAIYYEARGEVRTGQQAVAQVVLNRVRDPIYPKTVCGVVFQGEERKTGCQFSFTCDGSMDRAPRGPPWALARRLAEEALDGFVLRLLGGAVNYHNHTVVPYWSAAMKRAGEIGGHIFYASDMDLRSAYQGGEPLYAKAVLATLTADGGQGPLKSSDTAYSPPPPEIIRPPAPELLVTAADAAAAWRRGEPAVVATPPVITISAAETGLPPQAPTAPAWFPRKHGIETGLPVTGR